MAEALTFDDMLLSNLTTTSNGKPLETDGMIYFNATSNGEQLAVSKGTPVHIEIPTKNRKPGMMAYRGVRDENGNMNWVNPKPINNYLKTVDINSLDFLPPGFQNEVDKGMPFRGRKLSTPELTDSLYYSLSKTGKLFPIVPVPTNYNEPYYNPEKQVVNKKYTNDSYHRENDFLEEIGTFGINPAIVKVIKSEKFQNTFIATREFEARLQTIFNACNDTILEIYVRNLSRNLFELDSMAAQFCETRRDYVSFHVFDDFAKQHLTKVKDADKYAGILQDYYSKQLKRITTDLSKHHERWINEQKKNNAEAQKLADDYKKLLWKREKYRMETYGFDWTETGWVNVDNGTMPKDWGMEPLEIMVENGNQFDQINTYVVYTPIKSLYRLNSNDKVRFYVGDQQTREMLMPKQRSCIAIAIGFSNGEPFYGVKEFETGTETKVNLKLAPSSMDEIKKVTRQFDRFERENRLSIDLEFMNMFYKEEQRQKALMKESEFMRKLSAKAFPCGFDDAVVIENSYEESL